MTPYAFGIDLQLSNHFQILDRWGCSSKSEISAFKEISETLRTSPGNAVLEAPDPCMATGAMPQSTSARARDLVTKQMKRLRSQIKPKALPSQWCSPKGWNFSNAPGSFSPVYSTSTLSVTAAMIKNVTCISLAAHPRTSDVQRTKYATARDV